MSKSNELLRHFYSGKVTDLFLLALLQAVGVSLRNLLAFSYVTFDEILSIRA